MTQDDAVWHFTNQPESQSNIKLILYRTTSHSKLTHTAQQSPTQHLAVAFYRTYTTSKGHHSVPNSLGQGFPRILHFSYRSAIVTYNSLHLSRLIYTSFNEHSNILIYKTHWHTQQDIVTLQEWIYTITLKAKQSACNVTVYNTF